MAGTRAAIRYAKAVLDLAKDQNTVETVNNDMALIANSVEKSKDLSDMLQSPVLRSDVKKMAETILAWRNPGGLNCYFPLSFGVFSTFGRISDLCEFGLFWRIFDFSTMFCRFEMCRLSRRIFR